MREKEQQQSQENRNLVTPTPRMMTDQELQHEILRRCALQQEEEQIHMTRYTRELAKRIGQAQEPGNSVWLDQEVPAWRWYIAPISSERNRIYADYREARYTIEGDRTGRQYLYCEIKKLFLVLGKDSAPCIRDLQKGDLQYRHGLLYTVEARTRGEYHIRASSPYTSGISALSDEREAV